MNWTKHYSILAIAIACELAGRSMARAQLVGLLPRGELLVNTTSCWHENGVIR